VWLVPLWSGRGLLGLLFLGEKSAGGLYSQEELEIARASGERYLDTLACARMAQRLALLQRQRLAETRAAALPPLTAEVVLYAAREALRNAARHGRGDNPARPLHMTLAVRAREGLQITLTDDGVALAVARAWLYIAP
jgi:two-component sensor histidine kinase